MVTNNKCRGTDEAFGEMVKEKAMGADSTHALCDNNDMVLGRRIPQHPAARTDENLPTTTTTNNIKHHISVHSRTHVR